jgi:hypothetical protein
MAFAYTKARKEIDRPSSTHGFYVEGPLTSEDWREIIGYIMAEAIEQARSIAEGDGCPTESDDRLNEASRSLIAAVRESHGAAYLWRFNPVGEVICRKWNGEIVYNFDADAVTPIDDRELLKLIGDRITAPYTGTHEDARRLDLILDKLEEVGGMVLVWA